MSGRLVTEVPSSLKQLARLVVRGFYLVEDALIIDMLVRNPCMKEDDLCELLKFERKMLRARIDTLKNDKFIQTKMKMVTGLDGKTQRQNYYYINYKVFVNVVKYKLDHMRRKMETEERNATSRASFKCLNCEKTYTDLQADQLFDAGSGEFVCIICGSVVQEDSTAEPRHHSRLLLARFNDVMEPLFVLLKEVEGIKLAPELLEPEPLDIEDILHRDDRKRGQRNGTGLWSGEATRHSQETTINVQMQSEEDDARRAAAVKERPVWMVESTVVASSSSAVITAADHDQPDAASTAAATDEERGAGSLLPLSQLTAAAAKVSTAGDARSHAAATASIARDDIMSVLLQHEKRTGVEPRRAPAHNAPAHHSSSTAAAAAAATVLAQSGAPVSSQLLDGLSSEIDDDNAINSDDEQEDVDNVPCVQVDGDRVPICDVTADVIERMTSDQKEAYILAYQDYYSDMHE